MTTKSMNISASLLERELRVIFSSPQFDFEKETQKTIRERLTQRLKLEQFPSNKKGILKQLVVRLVNENQDEDKENDDNNDCDSSAKMRSESESSEEEEEEEERYNKRSSKKKKAVRSATKTIPKKKKKSTSTKKRKSSSSSSAYSSNVKSLLDLGMAIRMGPRLHRGLKDMDDDEERIATLTDRLKEAGAKWKGYVPTSHEISRAKAEKQRKDDLDGLDTSLILDEGRSRRRGRAVVNYANDDDDHDDDDDEDNKENNEFNNNNDINDEDEERPRKKKKKQVVTSSDDDDNEDEDFDGNESSEAEFDL